MADARHRRESQRARPGGRARTRPRRSDAGRQSGVGTGTANTQLGRVPGASISVGPLPAFTPATMFVVPVREMSGVLNHQIDGVLGVDFMRRHVVEFNYAAGAVIFHDPRFFVYQGYAQVLPIELHENLLVVAASLTMPDGETLPVRLLIDTGRIGPARSEWPVRARAPAGRAFWKNQSDGAVARHQRRDAGLPDRSAGVDPWRLKLDRPRCGPVAGDRRAQRERAIRWAHRRITAQPVPHVRRFSGPPASFSKNGATNAKTD